MQEDTTITLIKQSIQNFEETKDVEHLNDIIQIIFEYKKSQQRHLLTHKIISLHYFTTTILQ